MERLKLKTDTGFWLFIVAAILLKRGYFAATYTLAVLLHELSHYFVASKLFYHCTEVRLGIFGAVLYGDFENVTPPARAKIAIAGPACNVILCLICLALWWIFPDAYVFTEDLFSANAAMAAVNLLPCYPLDGGRILTAVLEKKLPRKRCLQITKQLTVVLSLAIFAFFVIAWCFGTMLLSVGSFAACLFLGILDKSGGECYVKSSLAVQKRRLVKIGMEKKTLVFDQNALLGDVEKRMQGNYLYCLECVDDDMQVVFRFSVAELEHAVVTGNPSDRLFELKASR